MLVLERSLAQRMDWQEPDVIFEMWWFLNCRRFGEQRVVLRSMQEEEDVKDVDQNNYPCKKLSFEIKNRVIIACAVTYVQRRTMERWNHITVAGKNSNNIRDIRKSSTHEKHASLRKNDSLYRIELPVATHSDALRESTRLIRSQCRLAGSFQKETQLGGNDFRDKLRNGLLG
ncbi:hypothetical protein CEXT_97931 [Caerostris extrusa]|uniref:Uncharacterized protein n=1 Tax=Caerostris extrusa TaxID=172846 RepID=A0AAV4V7Z0_CAEEX|nr:hypothetical protein CEXT_97931 [Caerostris extrusa]